MSTQLYYVFSRTSSGHLGCDVRLHVPGNTQPIPEDPQRLLRRPEVGKGPPTHRRLLMQLVMHGSAQKGRVVLRGSNGFALARDLVGSGRAFWLRSDGQPLSWRKPRAVQLAWVAHADGAHATLLIAEKAADFILPLTPPLFLDARPGDCGPLKGDIADGVLGEWVEPREPMPLKAALAFCNSLSRRFPKTNLPTPGREAEQVPQRDPPTTCLIISSRALPAAAGEDAPSADMLIVQLLFDYGAARLAMSAPEETMVALLDGKTVRRMRDRRLEKSASERLRALGFVPVEECFNQVVATPLRDWVLRPDATTDWGSLQVTVWPALEADGWRIEQDSGCRVEMVEDAAWFSELEEGGEGWFTFSVGVRVGRHRVNLLPVVQRFLAENRMRSIEEMALLLEGRRVPVPLANQTFALITGGRLLLVIRHLLELFDRKVAHDARGRMRLDLWRAAEITALEQLAASPWTRPAALRSLAERLAGGVGLKPLAGPASLQTTLRPYQQLGLAWLQFLRASAFDGILADDMGLGKTVQALAHLLLEKEAGRLTRPCLIVAPTSVIQNWVDESRRFAPNLRIVVLQGAARTAEFANVAGADVVLTSYALLRQDAEFLHAQTFALAILDEGHYIKNFRAQTTQVARGIRAERRLCLTGTPLENNLGELWSLFQFLMPGFLGSAESFRARFRVPIEKEGSALARQFLSGRLAPFLLRRQKGEVERDLPSKTVTVRRIPLADRQRELYETVRLTMETRIQEEVAERGLDRSRIMVLSALMKLRQVCCDPRLARSQEAQVLTSADSAKLQALLEMLDELLEEGRRVLLFSQFVGMLTLIEAELHSRRRDYALLTGSTRDRTTPIRRFQDHQVPLFLISLKAGGTGLNLTAADTVIHYDPWWNPAAEAQATDRAHRIGQDKPVFVYRLLTLGTVEERIHALQARKQQLAAGILKSQRADSIRFAQEDLDALLAPIG